MEQTSFWKALHQAATQPDEGRVGVRTWLQEKVDLAHYRPDPAPDIEVSHLIGRKGDHYILKNLATKTYYRLDERDHFLWQRMDGSRTVKELVVAYYMEYKSFAFARAGGLVEGLKASLMLNERPVNAYQQVAQQLAGRRPLSFTDRLLGSVLSREFAIKDIDGALASVYRLGGWLLFTRPALMLYLLMSVAGLYCFVRAFASGRYALAGSGLGALGLVLTYLLVIFVHEMAHALTVKHYGREVRRGGAMLYYGSPAFFVDTMDIWMEGKRARLAVSWAGPFSGFVLGGLAAIILTLWPEFDLNPLLFQVALITFMLGFFNFNPLLELDGYYLLMDALEIPALRRKSLDFIRRGLWAKIKNFRQARTPLKELLASFSREERIFVIFGLLASLWSAYALFAAAYTWQRRLADWVRDTWSGGNLLMRILVVPAAAAVGFLLITMLGRPLLRLGRGIVDWMSRRGLLSNTWILAAMLLPLVAALFLATTRLGYPAVAPYVRLATLAMAAFFAWRSAGHYAGARLAPVFRLWALFALLLLLREGVLLIGQAGLPAGFLAPDLLEPLQFGLGHLAFLVLALAGLLDFAHTDLRALRPLEKGLLALGLALAYGLMLWLAGGPPRQWPPAEALAAVSAGLLPLLVLTLTVPSLFSFWSTAFGPAWALLALACAALAAIPLLGLPPLAAYLLLATGFLLYHLAFSQLALVAEPPVADVSLDDRQRLRRAFGWTADSILTRLHQIAGRRSAHKLAEEFNSHALAAGWRLNLVRGRVEDNLPEELGIIECGGFYAPALDLLLDLVAGQMGEKLAVLALQRAYDGLPWEEREIGAQHLFSCVKRAAALGDQFRATERDYRGLLRRMPLLATMDQAEIDLLVSRLRLEEFAPGQVLIRQGEVGDRFYILRRGHVEVTARDERGVSEVVDHKDPGDYFGEVALLHDAPRNATCRATVPSQALTLNRHDFDQLVKARFTLGEKMGRTLERAGLLRRIPLFAELDGGQIQLIAARLREEVYQPGATIIRQGEPGETFYLVESGRVRVTVDKVGVEQEIDTLGPGEYFGETALLLDVPRTASVYAGETSHLLALHRNDFERLVAGHLYVGRGLDRITSRRMRNIQRAMRG